MFKNKRLFRFEDKDHKNAHLIGGMCKSCKNVHFPKMKVCFYCFEQNGIEEIELSQKGIVYSYSIVRRAPRGYDAPYVTLYVDLPEGVRIFAQSPLTLWDNETDFIGKEVEVFFDKVGETNDGEDIVGYKFRPI